MNDLDFDPACWSWEVTAEVLDLLNRAARTTGKYQAAILVAQAVQKFHQHRCGICGIPSGDDVEDHDHDTGRVRGPLCRGCNVREGAHPGGENDVYARYRRRYPLAILGIDELYSGRDWENGVRLDAPPAPDPGWDLLSAARACFGGAL